jgi:hypothetical protein
MSGTERQFLIHVEEGTEIGPLKGSKGDMEFPIEVRGWSDVLDCRHTPYTEKTLTELRYFAHHVNKSYILVPESTIETAAAAEKEKEATEEAKETTEEAKETTEEVKEATEAATEESTEEGEARSSSDEE